MTSFIFKDEKTILVTSPLRWGESPSFTFSLFLGSYLHPTCHQEEGPKLSGYEMSPSLLKSLGETGVPREELNAQPRAEAPRGLQLPWDQEQSFRDSQYLRNEQSPSQATQKDTSLASADPPQSQEAVVH